MSYCTTDDVKAYLGIASDADDALITVAAAAVRIAINNYTRRIFDADSDSVRYFCSNSELVYGRSLHLGRDGELAEAPASVVIDGTDVTAYVNVYGTLPYRKLFLSSDCPTHWRDYGESDPEEAIAITGKWGYSTEPPDAIKQAAVIWSAFLYQIKDVNPGGVLAQSTDEQRNVAQDNPVHAIALLNPYRRLL